MHERCCVAGEVIGMVPRVTCLAGLREVVLAVCFATDGCRGLVVNDVGPN